MKQFGLVRLVVFCAATNFLACGCAGTEGKIGLTTNEGPRGGENANR